MQNVATDREQMRPLGEIGTNGRKILQYNLRNQCARAWNGSTLLRIWISTGLCEHGDGP